MKINSGIFKAYDIRGVYEKDFDEETAYTLGRAIVQFLKPKNVVVGYDMRSHSRVLFENLSKGIIEQGADVINIGLVSSPINYYANWTMKADVSVMITASHNPPEYNGFKIAIKGAQTLSNETGLLDIKKLIDKNDFEKAEKKGEIIKKEIVSDYYKYILSYGKKTNLKIVSDYSNAMGVVEAGCLNEVAKVVPLYDNLDSNLPNHEANPAKHEVYNDLSLRVTKEKADLGILFDGDADRVGFTDENGKIISPDLIIGLVGKYLIKKEVTKNVVYDLRSTKALDEIFKNEGGKGVKVRVGNPFVKLAMKENDASFGGELAGHFMFKENSYGESALLTVIYILNILEESKKKLSELVSVVSKYPRSEEINLEVEEKELVLEKLEAMYEDGKINHMDGLSVEFSDWWFNIRMSNTEPVIRVNIEADDKDILKEKRKKILIDIQEIIEHKK